eukprot:TRINITY_DN15428_c0_g1_i1.p1 TRINITY_DN15428_c0_g1~~TRINITY_DN15428_c0_g1_i1.p1  ORF type:complete len:702 (+),score=167.05 TRINITY_DN15428_c0_g1_i1:46-2106(+)
MRAPWSVLLLVPGAAGAGCVPGLVGCPASTSCCGIVACPDQNVPACRTCSSALDCSNHANDPIGGDGYRCYCELRCRNGWKERDCSLCPAPLGGNDCDGCLPGMVPCPQSSCPATASPQCRLCDADADCSSHATAITSNGYQCQCTCRNAWAGTDATGRSDCSKCISPQGHGPLNDCEACATGWRIISRTANMVATCQRCDSNMHCSGNDVPGTVSSDGVNCCCTCRNAWTGPTCNQCPSGYSGTDCDQCDAQALGVYPLCYARSVTVIGGEFNGTVMQRRHVVTTSACPVNLTAADWIVECGDEARREATSFYDRRDRETEVNPQALFFYAVDSHARDVAGDEVPCVERRWPMQMTERPADQHDVEVCRVSRVGGLSAEFAGFPQICSIGIDRPPWHPQVTRIDPTINYAPTASGWSGVPGPSDFASRWQGQLQITQAGNHTFRLSSDDGGRLWIDGQLVVDNSVNKPSIGQCQLYQKAEGWTQLTPGFHTVVVKHFQLDTFAGAELQMSGPTTCNRMRTVSPWEFRPLPTFFIWRTTPTPSLTITPSVTPMGLCYAFGGGTTMCVDNIGSGYSHLAWLLFLVLLLVLVLAFCCKQCANSSRKRGAEEVRRMQEREAAELEEQDLGNTLPDPDGGICVSVRRVDDAGTVQSPWKGLSRVPLLPSGSLSPVHEQAASPEPALRPAR